MLTIKHIDQDGNERLIECHSFVRERRKDGLTQFLAYGERPLPCDYIATWCGDQNKGKESLLNWETIYVMNRFGATVATYNYLPPCFEPAVPEPIAA